MTRNNKKGSKSPNNRNIGTQYTFDSNMYPNQNYNNPYVNMHHIQTTNPYVNMHHVQTTNPYTNMQHSSCYNQPNYNVNPMQYYNCSHHIPQFNCNYHMPSQQPQQHQQQSQQQPHVHIIHNNNPISDKQHTSYVRANSNSPQFIPTTTLNNPPKLDLGDLFNSIIEGSKKKKNYQRFLK